MQAACALALHLAVASDRMMPVALPQNGTISSALNAPVRVKLANELSAADLIASSRVNESIKKSVSPALIVAAAFSSP